MFNLAVFTLLTGCYRNPSLNVVIVSLLLTGSGFNFYLICQFALLSFLLLISQLLLVNDAGVTSVMPRLLGV